MKYLRFDLLLITCTVILSATTGFAAEAEQSAQAMQSAAAAKIPINPPLVTVDFPGGTIAQLVAAIAKTPGGPINIVGEQKDLATMLPPFSVQNANPMAFAQALGQLLDIRGLMIQPTVGGSGTKEIFVVRRNPGRGDMRESFESIQLAPYLEQQKIDDIIGAIRAAWELDPTHDTTALRLKFHPASTILLISGPQEATQIALRVVNTLRRAPNPIPAPTSNTEKK